jgi:glycosyltransferase involved in cell wall biosynthesis
MRLPRVVILTSIMAPHRIASFNALAAQPDLDIVFVYLAETDPSRAWSTHDEEMRFRYQVLRERWKVRRGPSYSHVSTGLMRALRELRPDVLVVGGWDQASYLLAYALRDVLRARFLWWVESNLRDRRPEASMLRSIKRRLIAGVDGVIVPGSASRDYVAALGAVDERIWEAPNAVDNERYRRRVVNRAGHTGPTRVLFAGRLESEKGVLTLLDAWSIAGADGELAIVGDGSLRHRLASRVSHAVMPPVRLLGHLDRDDLADRYAGADLFVFPSVSDPWGLVLNEAMAAGLPVVASSSPGAVDDLVQQGRNGLIVAPFDTTALAGAMSTLIADPTLRVSMGAESSSIVRGFEPEAWAAGMRQAALSVLSRAV